MAEGKKHIIIAERMPEEREKFLNLPDLTPEEEKALEKQAAKEIENNAEPLFSEISPKKN